MKIVCLILLVLFITSSVFALVQGYEQDEKLSNKANRMLRTLHQRTWPFISEINSAKPTTEILPQGWAAVTKDNGIPPVYGLNFNIGGKIVGVKLVTGDTT